MKQNGTKDEGFALSVVIIGVTFVSILFSSIAVALSYNYNSSSKNAAAIGGWAVTKFGFSTVLLFVGVFGLVGSVLLLALRNNIKGVFDHGLHFSFHDIFNKEKQ